MATNPPIPPKPPEVVKGPGPVDADAKAQEAALKLLDDKRRELTALESAKEVDILQAKIDALKRGDLTPALAKRRKKQEATRDAAVKETIGGKEFAVYIHPAKSFRDGRLLPPGSAVKLPIDELPGEDWLPATKEAPKPASEYVAKA